jgi:hypothetical protein
MRAELKEIADVVVVVMEVVVETAPIMVKLGVIVTEPWPVLVAPLSVNVVIPKEPPPPPEV